MIVTLDAWAWVPKAELTVQQLHGLRRALTVVPKKSEFDTEDPKPLHLFTETATHFGMAREFALSNRKAHHNFVLNVSEGDKSTWPGPLTFAGTPRPEQDQAVSQVAAQFLQGAELGGLIQASPGWGKTVAASALMARLQVPTLVVVHKEFLMNQWQQRLEQFLPGIQIGFAQQDVLDYVDKHVVLGMVHTLADRQFSKEFINWPGLVIVDECFPAGTAVATPAGARAIETLAVGELVVCAAGVGTVVKTYARAVPLSELRLILFEDGTEQVCTAKHPFLSASGWEVAANLEGRAVLTAAGCFDTMCRNGTEAVTPASGDVRAVQQAEVCAGWSEVLLSAVYGEGEAAEGTAPVMRTVWPAVCESEGIAFLFRCLSGELVGAGAEAPGASDVSARDSVAHGQSTHSSGGVVAYARAQSDEACRDAESSQQSAQGQRTQALGERGEWHGVDGSTATSVDGAGRGVGRGARSVDRSFAQESGIASESLQAGHCESRSVVGDRSGRRDSRSTEGAEGRSQERGVPAFLWVVRVAIPEQSDLARLGICVEADSGGVRVHNLTVDRHPSYVLSRSRVLVHNCHRIGAATWSVVPGKFPAKWRLGITATPRRKDGTEKVFQYHIGRILFTAKEQRMKPKIRKIHTTFQVVKTPSLNANTMSRMLLLRFLCANPARVGLVANQTVLAVQAGRKVLVLSERIAHLEAIEKAIARLWPTNEGKFPTIDYYIGGRTEKERERASKAQIILATSQFASEGLDIPALDTLVLATPMSDVEQAVGRILRPHEGKKPPIVVDIRDDRVGMFKSLGEKRDRLYERIT